MPPQPPKSKIVKEISPLSFEEEAMPVSKIEKVWIAFFSGSIITTQDMSIAMGLTLLLVTLTSFGEILWKKIHPNPEALSKK